MTVACSRIGRGPILCAVLHVVLTTVLAACAPYGGAITAGMLAGVTAAQMQHRQADSDEPIEQTLLLLEHHYVEPVDYVQLLRGTLAELQRRTSPSLTVGERDPSTLQVSCGADSLELDVSDLHASTAAKRLRELEPLVAACREREAAADDFDYTRAAVQAVLTAADPAAHLILPHEPNQGGVGLELTRRDGAVVVVESFEGFAAARAGIRRGDRILSIDAVGTADLTLVEIIERLRGPVDSTVSLRIAREGDEPVEVTLAREAIYVDWVSERMAAEGIGYIRIRQFHEDTSRRAYDFWRRLQEYGAFALVLDLRNSSGGLLRGSIQVAGLFLEPASSIGAVKERACRSTKEVDCVAADGGLFMQYHASESPKIEAWPLVVLVNGGTYAGAEIIAAALQDHGKARVIGSSTAGRDGVDTVFPLSKEHWAIRFRTGTIYRAIPEPALGSAPVIPDEEVAGDSQIGAPDDVVLKRALELISEQQGGI